MPGYQRFVALGDSQTEGLNDLDADGRAIGWADRFAARLAATTSPGLTYANLAVRGCRARHVREVQLPAALALEPDLASVAVGMNDVLRHDYDEAAVLADVEETFAALSGIGCRILTMTFPDVARMLPVMGWLRPREARLNERLAALAEQYDATLLDLFPLAMSGDPAVWSHDRIHGSVEGHRRIAEGMAEVCGLAADPTWSSGAGARQPLPTVVRRDAVWLAGFLGPFLYRQLRGRGPMSTGVAKQPTLLPVVPEPDAQRPGRRSDRAV